MDSKPALALPSHRKHMKYDELTEHLEMLVIHFDTIAKPEQGRFVNK